MHTPGISLLENDQAREGEKIGEGGMRGSGREAYRCAIRHIGTEGQIDRLSILMH